MNTFINSNENSIFEFAKRSIYSLQVLLIGIAIPVLFLLGISTTGSQKKAEEKQLKQITTTTPSARPVIGLYIPQI